MAGVNKDDIHAYEMMNLSSGDNEDHRYETETENTELTGNYDVGSDEYTRISQSFPRDNVIENVGEDRMHETVGSDEYTPARTSQSVPRANVFESVGEDRIHKTLRTEQYTLARTTQSFQRANVIGITGHDHIHGTVGIDQYTSARSTQPFPIPNVIRNVGQGHVHETYQYTSSPTTHQFPTATVIGNVGQGHMHETVGTYQYTSAPTTHPFPTATVIGSVGQDPMHAFRYNPPRIFELQAQNGSANCRSKMKIVGIIIVIVIIAGFILRYVSDYDAVYQDCKNTSSSLYCNCVDECPDAIDEAICDSSIAYPEELDFHLTVVKL